MKAALLFVFVGIAGLVPAQEIAAPTTGETVALKGTVTVTPAASAHGRRPRRKATEAEQKEKEAKFRFAYFADGDRFAYSLERVVAEPKSVFDTEGAEKMVVLYDGTRTLEIVGSGDSAIVYPGRKAGGLTFLPLPGVGLPGAPLAKPRPANAPVRANYTLPPEYVRVLAPYSSSRADGPFIYRNGAMASKTVDELPQVQALICGLPGYALEEWKFGGHEKIGGLWLAKKVTWIGYEQGEGGSTGKPWTERRYEIDSFSVGKPTEDAISAKGYLKPGATIVERSPDGKDIHYQYDPTKSWEDNRIGGATDGRVVTGILGMRSGASVWAYVAPTLRDLVDLRDDSRTRIALSFGVPGRVASWENHHEPPDFSLSPPSPATSPGLPRPLADRRVLASGTPRPNAGALATGRNRDSGSGSEIGGDEEADLACVRRRVVRKLP